MLFILGKIRWGILRSELKMADLRLVSTRKRQLKPLVEAALSNELRLLESGIRRTEQKILQFEEKYHLRTQELISRYENDELGETLDSDEWIGEFRLLSPPVSFFH